MQVAKMYIRTYTTDASLPLWGYYRCSKCEALNCFKTVVSISQNSSYRWVSWLRSKGLETRLRRKRSKVIENAKKENFYQPRRFTGRCVKCNHVEFWQQLKSDVLTKAMVLSPAVCVVGWLLLTAMNTRNIDWILIMAPCLFVFFWLACRLYSIIQNAKGKTVPKESMPSYFDDPKLMFTQANNALKSGEKPQKNETIHEN